MVQTFISSLNLEKNIFTELFFNLSTVDVFQNVITKHYFEPYFTSSTLLKIFTEAASKAVLQKKCY